MGDTFGSAGFSASNYAQHRPKYPPELHKAIFKTHNALKGAGHDLVVDLGCGPGTATAPLVPHFKKVIGVDPGEGMLTQARQEVPQAEFRVGSAESLPFLAKASVDLIVAATCAHWFPANWWKEAERVLKPTSTVALFIYGRPVGRAFGMENDTLQIISDTFLERVGSRPAGSDIARNMYEELPLPDSNSSIKLLKRQWWNKDGRIDETEEGGRGKFVISEKMTLQGLRGRASTGGAIHRWRTAHPDLAGTPQDPLEQVIAEIKEKTGLTEESVIDVGHPLVCIFFTKQID